MESTKFSNLNCLVLQICPEERPGLTIVNGNTYPSTAAFIYIPTSPSATTISCSFNYFQDNCSISEKWILNDENQKMQLSQIDSLTEIIITIKQKGIETLVPMPGDIPTRLLKYFKDNLAMVKGFDCYAFQSFLANAKFFPPSPPWEYTIGDPQVGEQVALCNSDKLPESIKHWAIYLGNDLYLSKFGKSGYGSDAYLTVMTLEGMKILYNCSRMYIISKKANAKPWSVRDLQ